MKKTFLLVCTLFLCITMRAQIVSGESTLNLKNLYKEILKDSIKFPEIVLRQAIVETGWLKSVACLKRNNLFGFNNGVTKYKSWQESVMAYKKWQDKRYKEGPYDIFLIKIKYAADTKKYVLFLKKIKIPEETLVDF